MKRTLAKETPQYKGKKVSLFGWVKNRRDHGKIIFIDLRDRSGMVQVVVSPKEKESYEMAGDIRDEWVIEITGEVSERPEGTKNKNIDTGEVEVKAENIKVFSKSETPPFSLDGDGYDISEEKRLEYRYLDLRRKRLQDNLRIRQDVMQYVRNFLRERDFTEIETPILTKSTPEGARDFLVPSRLQKGKFYALPQSPQQYKQLLMIAGMERYFQFPHVFRDEDLRADRLFEHTQLDTEMSFITEEQIREMIEQLVIEVTEKILGKKIQEKPFPKIDYQEAMEKYGKDDPDIRKDKNDENLMAYAWIINFPMFEEREDGSIGAQHHPFTAIKDEDIEKLKEGKDKKDKTSFVKEIHAKQYDLVLNGHEVFGGSIREHRAEILQTVFEFMGHKPEEIKEKFGHLLEAFSYGVPPHGGIASGLDRWLQVLLAEKSIRETLAFPTTTSGKTSVMDAPSEVDEKQLKELGIKVIKDENKDK